MPESQSAFALHAQNGPPGQSFARVSVPAVSTPPDVSVALPSSHPPASVTLASPASGHSLRAPKQKSVYAHAHCPPPHLQTIDGEQVALPDPQGSYVLVELIRSADW